MLFFISAWAKATIYAPISTIRLSQKGILQPALDFGKGGVWSHGYIGGPRSGGNGAALSVALPFAAPSESKRLSGWSWGFSGGLSDTSYIPGQFYSPALYYMEAMLGRGTTFPLLERDSGLRGFLEFAFRDDRSRSKDQNQEVFQTVRRVFPKHQYSLAIRMGATQALEGEGLVEQGKSWISYRLIYAFYVPLSNQLPLMTVHAGALIRCGLKGLACGLAGDFVHIWPNKKNADQTLDLREYLALGPALQWKITRGFAAKTHIFWNSYYGASGTGASKIQSTHISKSPSGEIDLSLSF